MVCISSFLSADFLSNSIFGKWGSIRYTCLFNFDPAYFRDMTVKILKILTLVLYLGIQVSGEHVGGPLILFVLVGMLSSSWLTVFESAMILVAVVISAVTGL